MAYTCSEPEREEFEHRVRQAFQTCHQASMAFQGGTGGDQGDGLKFACKALSAAITRSANAGIAVYEVRDLQPRIGDLRTHLLTAQSRVTAASAEATAVTNALASLTW